MEKVAKEVLFYFFVGVIIYGIVVAKSIWITILCVVIGLAAAVFWIGWDWFVAVIRHGRTYRG